VSAKGTRGNASNMNREWSFPIDMLTEPWRSSALSTSQEHHKLRGSGDAIDVSIKALWHSQRSHNGGWQFIEW
jgi:hypothetical protein